MVQLVLTLTPDGRFGCSGPLDNKLLCYGLLEMGRQAVQAHQSSPIVRPDGVLRVVPPPDGR